MAFDALLFDMDGLLLDTERLACRSFQTVAATLGVPPEKAEGFFLTLVGTSNAVTRQMVSEFLPDVEIDTFRAKWTDAMQDLIDVGIPLRPHVFEVLSDLQAQGHRMAVVTSTTGDRARHHLGQAGILDRFERVTGGDEVSANKPDPAPYRDTARSLGVDPGRCAAFEDSDLGIASATSAGCVAVQIPDLRPPDRPLPKLGQHVAVDLRAAMIALKLL